KGVFPFVVFKGRFDPPSFRVDLAIKDLQLALACGEELSAPLPLSRAALEAYQRVAARGLGAKDVAAAITLLEESAGVTVRVAE
ncbi:MAG: NAD-binding protein, partial [Chloroflexota bacterium]|nr:NAD-binding protein [Chloroflexota bacterium]